MIVDELAPIFKDVELSICAIYKVPDIVSPDLIKYLLSKSGIVVFFNVSI